MNKTTTRFTLSCLLLLCHLLVLAQHPEITQVPSNPVLVCPDGNGQSARIIKIAPNPTGENFVYEYGAAPNWTCCLSQNQLEYTFYVPQTGALVELRRKYFINGNFVYQALGQYYSPITPLIDAPPSPSSCSAATGRIVVTDRSGNFPNLPRTFKLYDQNNVLRGNVSTNNKSYSFENLPAGTYKIVLETECNNIKAEKTGIVVATIGQNPSLTIALNGHDDCLENNISASIILPESIPTAGVQYRMDGGTWQSSNTFTNVTPWLTHQFAARLSGCFESSTTQLVSELSLPRIQGLERAKDTDCTPSNNEIRVFVPEGSDAQIQFNQSGGWYNPGQWVGPLPDGTLHIRARSAYLPSCYRDTSINLSEHGSVNLIGADAGNLNDCTLGNISLQLRTEPAVSTGLEYFVAGKGWQNSAQFSGLNNGDKRIAIRSTGLCQVGIGADTITLNEIIPPQIESIAPQGHDDCVVGNAGFTVYLVQSISGVKFRINGGAWQEGNLFQNRPAGSYLVEVARADGSCLSSQNYALVETGSVSITGLSKANENDCVVGNAQFQVLHTGGTQTGLKFRLNGGAWRDSVVFRNLGRMAVLVEAQIQQAGCSSGVVSWADSIREQSNFPEIASVTITGDKNCTVGAQVAFTLKVPMTATYWLSPVKNNTTGVFPGLASGTYTFQVYKNANGCVQTRVVTIDEKLGFTLDSLRVQGGDDCLNNNAAVTIYHPYGNNYGLQFREVNRNTPWQNSNAFPLSTHGVGQYNLEARNANGCALWSGSIYGQERLNPEITGVVGIDGLSDCTLGNVTAQIQLLNSSAGTTKQYRLNGGAWNLSSSLPGFRHGPNLVELTYNFGGLGTKQCTINKSIIIDEKAKEITGVLLDAATLNDCNLNNVRATIQVDGGTSNLRYVVTGKTEGTSNIFTNLNNGQYRAIIRDVVSTCRDTMVFNVAETPALALPAPTVQNVICFGAATGSISISPTGGVSPYSYLWSTGATSASVTGLAAGTYSVTVSDSRGCSLSQTLQVTGPAQNNLPQISFTGSTSICKGASFSISASASGGGSYAWNTGPTSSTISGSPENTTTYTLTVTNGLGCSASANRIITVNALPVPNIEGINTICAGQSTILTATGGSTYAWQHGANTAAITVNPAITTTYKVTVTNAAQCSAIYNRTVKVNALPLVQIAGIPTGPLCGTSTVVLTATGATTYQWGSGETTATIQRTITSATSIGVTGKDVNGCESSASGSISVIPRPVAQILGGDIPCRGNSTVLTAIGGSNYLWSNNATTSSIAISQPTQDQTYSVTVSNGPGCSATAQKTVVVPAALSLTAQIQNDQDCVAGNVQVVANATGGQGTLRYQLDNGAFQSLPTFLNVSNGQHTLVVQDVMGCSASANFTIAELSPLQLPDPVVQAVNCFGESNGRISLNPTGGTAPYQYTWSNGSSTAVNQNLRAGTYAVTVTDANGCTVNRSISVSEPTDIGLNLSITASPTCYGGSDGVLQSTVEGGSPAYTYAWSNGGTTAAISNLPANGYSLTVTDAHGCLATASITTTQPTPVTVSYTLSNDLDCIQNNVIITTNASGGRGNYRYRLDGGALQTSGVFNNKTTGAYTLIAQDGAGCNSLPTSININEALPLSLSYSLQNDQDCIAGNVNVIPIPSNAQGAVSYVIVPQATWDFSTDLQQKGNGTYTLSGIDAKGCMASTTVSISEAPPIKLSASIAGDTTDCIIGNVQVNFSTLNARGTAVYRLNNPQNGTITTANFSSRTAQYQVFVQDSIGCIDSVRFAIKENTPPKIIGHQLFQQEDCIVGNTQLQIKAIDAESALRYQIQNQLSQASSIFTNLPVGYIKAYVQDSSGCVDSSLVLIEEENFPRIDTLNVSNCDTIDGVIRFLHSRSQTPWEYSINDGRNWQASDAFTQLPAGIYLPAVRKTSTGCILKGDSIRLGLYCQTLPIAAFQDSIIYLTSPDQILDLKWKIEGKPIFKKGVDLILRMEGNGFPHFSQRYFNSNLPELRSDNDQKYPFQYPDGTSRRDSMQMAMGDSALYYTYPVVYFFHLEKPNSSAVVIDPKRNKLKVVVTLNAPPAETFKTVYLCPDQDCLTIGESNAVNCTVWQDEPANGGNKQLCRPIDPQKDYVQYRLNDQFEVVEIIHYKIVEVNFTVNINPDAKQPQGCQGMPLKLNAELNGLDQANAAYLWSNGATTSSITLPSPTPGLTISVKVTDKISKCEASAEYQIPNSNDNACKLYDYFTGKGFYAIKITVRKPAANQPELRADPCINETCSGASGICVSDNSKGLTFDLRGGQVGSVANNVNNALNAFQAFGYNNGKGLITENTGMCTCEGNSNFLTSTEQRFEESELGYWLHIWEKGDSDCGDSDILFIKAKLPGSSQYSPGEDTSPEFLDAALNHLSRDLGINDGKMVQSTMDLMLPNYAVPKDNTLFENNPKRQVLADVEIITPCNIGFNADPVGAILMTGHIVQMPAEIVTRYDLAPKLTKTPSVAQGVLTGFTTFAEGKIKGIYAGRYRRNSRYHVGYFSLGETEFNLISSYPFDPPGGSPVRIYSGNYNSIKEIDNCTELIDVYEALVTPVKGFASQPDGEMITDILQAVDVDPFSGPLIKTYPICGHQLKSILPGLTSLNQVSAYIFYNDPVVGTGVMYQLETPDRDWIFAKEINGTIKYFFWNCYLASWMELLPGSVASADAAKIEILYNKLKDKDFQDQIHFAIGQIGLVAFTIFPVVGVIIEAADILLYLYEGDIKNAALGAGFMAIGFAPQISKAIKVLNGVLKSGDDVVRTFGRIKCVTGPGVVSNSPELRSTTSPCRLRLLQLFPEDQVTKLVNSFSKSSSDELTEEFLKILEKADGAEDIFKLVGKFENNAKFLANVWLEVKTIPKLAGNESKLIDLINDLSKNERLLLNLGGFGGGGLVNAWYLAASSGLDVLRVNLKFLKALKDHIALPGVPKFTQYGCSLVDEGLIRYYTTGASESLNLALEGKLPMTPELLEFKNKLDIALGKLPNESRTVYRGVGAGENPDLDSWVEGGEKTFDKFLSTSINPNEAEKFRVFEKGKYFLEIESKTGKNIAALSSLPEEEILFKTGAIFDIVRIRPDPNNASRIIIKLTER